jgi:hypothetical protein
MMRQPHSCWPSLEKPELSVNVIFTFPICILTFKIPPTITHLLSAIPPLRRARIDWCEPLAPALRLGIVSNDDLLIYFTFHPPFRPYGGPWLRQPPPRGGYAPAAIERSNIILILIFFEFTR